MTRYIEYCRTNVEADARASFAALDATVVEKCCLRRCGTCYTDPFLVVDGEPRRGESHAALVAALREESE
ncbi:DUF1450 domain-containing protein [Haloprofundus halobius]|uniref:DUF1450 domain-containing protein n=1 Tax=Haloprofundus halobius TaxID=2876194 RepID=UPI001CCEF6C2|nr:DUF1450 domain-containing protein [Haloprofundus halobius]